MKHAVGIGMLILGCAPLFATRPNKQPAGNDKQASARHVVDAGSFGIYLNGRRVGTEKFHVEQGSTSSIATSEVVIDDGNVHASQGSELELTASGALLHYHWHQDSPEKAQATVEPNTDFLIQRTTLQPDQKPMEQPYVLPASTPILDDYFFLHREILAWRYLASVCQPAAGRLECKPGPGQFGVLIPRQHTSVPVQVEYKGLDKVTVHGAQQELSHFTISSEGSEMQLWLDRNYKLIRVVAEGTEVVRD